MRNSFVGLYVFPLYSSNCNFALFQTATQTSYPLVSGSSGPGWRPETLNSHCLSSLRCINGSRRIYWALQWTSIPFREEATETGDKRRPDGPFGSHAAFTLPSGPARFTLGTQIKGKNLFLYQLQCGSRPLLINSFNIREKITPYHTMTFHIPVGLYHWMSYKRFEIAKTNK